MIYTLYRFDLVFQVNPVRSLKSMIPKTIIVPCLEKCLFIYRYEIEHPKITKLTELMIIVKMFGNHRFRSTIAFS